jgi:hypothetical protein
MSAQVSHRNRIIPASTLSVPARVLTVAVGLMTAAATFAAPARADTIDNAFLGALNNAGVSTNDPAGTIALGQSVCPMLVEPGKSFASVASSVGAAPNGVSPDMAAFFTGIAISMYCPTMMSSVGNGTFLNWLQAPGLDR